MDLTVRVDLTRRHEAEALVEGLGRALALTAARVQRVAPVGTHGLGHEADGGGAVAVPLVAGVDEEAPEVVRPPEPVGHGDHVPAHHHETHRHPVGDDGADPRMALGLGGGVDERPGDPGDELVLGRRDTRSASTASSMSGAISRSVTWGTRSGHHWKPRHVEGSPGAIMVECSTTIRGARMTTTAADRAPVVYLSHGAPPLADDAAVDRRARGLVRRPAAAQRDPRRVGALGARPDRGLGHHWRRPPALRLLGLPAALLRGDLRRPRRPRARPVGGRAAVRRRRDPAPGPHPRARPRCLRAAEGDVPRGRRAGGAAVDADPRPAPAVRAR